MKIKTLRINYDFWNYKTKVLPLLWSFLFVILTSLTVVGQNDYLGLVIGGTFGNPSYGDSLLVYNPAVGLEWIRVLKDGRIQHNPGTSPIYIDNAIISRNTFFGPNTLRHATFSSGLWMTREWDPVDKKPTGPYLDVSGTLRVETTGGGRRELYVMNATQSVYPLGGANREYEFSSLPLQNYQYSVGLAEWNVRGSIYEEIDFLNGPIEFRFMDENIYHTAAEMDAIVWGTSSATRPTHVLPAETSKIRMKPPYDFNPNPALRHKARLYIGTTASFIPDINDPTHVLNVDYIEGVLKPAHEVYFEFDINDFIPPVGQQYAILGGQKIFVFKHYEDTFFNLDEINDFHIPVVVERPTEALSPFGHPTTGPLEVKMVLHDPPGSESYAVYEAGTTLCRTTEISIGTGDGSNHENTIQAGFSGSAGAGISVNIEATIGYTNDVENSSTSLSTTSMEDCTTIKNTITTSPTNGFADGGDVFMGHSNNYQMYYGKKYFWDESNGETYNSEGIVMEITGQNAFLKNESQIELELNDLCNALEALTQNQGESVPEFDLRRNLILQSMDTWYDMITDNKAIFNDPSILQIGSDEDIPQAGNSKEVSEILQGTQGTTTSQEILSTKSHGVDATVLVAGNGYIGSHSWSTSKSTGYSNDTQESEEITNTYFLKDSGSNDIEDFTVTIHRDPRFGNKFFRVKEFSRTSCPYEGGLRTDQPNIRSRIASIDPHESNQIYISGVPAGTFAVVPIDMCNLFAYTDPNVTGSFRIVREPSSGNGANVELINNDPLENSYALGDPYDIDFGTCFGDDQNQTVQNIFISQNSAGDLNYDESTDEIRLRFYSGCDESVYDVLSISVRFTNDPNEPLNMNAECDFLQDTDRAMNFDGEDDRIEIAVKKQPFIFNSFSYEFWVKPEGQLVAGQGENIQIPTQSAASTAGGFPFVIFPENGRDIGSNQVTVGVAVGTDGIQVVEHYEGGYQSQNILHSAVALNHAVSINDWTHVAVVYKKRVPTLYINGLEVATGLTSGFLGIHPSFQLGGGEINGKSNYFDGSIDDMRYWTYARTEYQIAEDMSNKLSGNEPGLVALYLFDGQVPGVNNTGKGLIEYAGVGEAEDAVFYNFDYGSTSSNWVTGRVAEWCSTSCPGSVDADADALTDCEDLCPNDRDTALDFAGGNNVADGDYVEVPHHTDLNIVDGDFTIEAWIYSTGSGHRTIVSKGNGFSATLTPYVFGIWDVAVAPGLGRLGLYLSGDWQFGNSSIPQNEWMHVAVSFDYSTKTATFFYNGIADGQPTFNSANTSFSNVDTNPMFISRQGFDTNLHNFTGKMDEIAIWNQALTAAEMAASMAAPYQGTEANLVAYYDFNDANACTANGGNITLIDKANNHNGTLNNFELSSACTSNWTAGHNKGSCNAAACPPNYAGGNSLVNTPGGNTDYESAGNIESTQIITSPLVVDYDSGTIIELLQGFEVKLGAVFHAFIDGCGNLLKGEEEEVEEK